MTRKSCVITMLSLSAAMLCFVAGPGQAQQTFKAQRVSPRDFAVMSWGSTPADPEQLEWLNQAGINIAGFGKVADLPAFEKAGLQIFVSDARANGYDFEKPLDEAVVRRNVQSLTFRPRRVPACASGRRGARRASFPAAGGMGQAACATHPFPSAAWVRSCGRWSCFDL